MSWFRRAKTRLGYYRLRRRLYERGFLRSLRPSDVFLVGHPKSGNTWLAYMLAVALFRDREHSVNLRNVGEYVPFVHGRDYHIARYGLLPDPRVFRNEYPEYAGHYPKTIYLVRDPRAVLLSFWHMYNTMFDVGDLSQESFLTQYLAGEGIFTWWNSKLERWDRQVQEAVGRAEVDASILILRYEELVEDREHGLLTALAFIQAGRTQDEIALAVERGSFGAMRRDEDEHGAEAYEGRAKGQGRFIRVGRTEAWRGELEPRQAARIAKEFGAVMELAGYR